MSYLTLAEAAQYVSNKTGDRLEPAALLRAGVLNVLPVCAPFGFGTMYNASTQQDEDFRAGLLIIPSSHLLEIETEGSAKIQVAHSLDGKTLYFPFKVRTVEQLRVMVSELDRLIPRLTTITQDSNAPAAKVEAIPANAKQTHKIKTRTHILDAVIESAKKSAVEATDAQSVMAELVKLAELPANNRPAPLIGFVEGEGVKYQAMDGIKFYTMKNLRDKMNRAKAR